MEAISKCRVVIFTFRAARLSGPSGSLNHAAASLKEPNKFCPQSRQRVRRARQRSKNRDKGKASQETKTLE